MNKEKLIENFWASDINIIKTNSILSKGSIFVNILAELTIKQSKSVFFHYEMFNGCSALTYLNIENFIFHQLNLIDENDEVFLELPAKLRLE